MPWQEHPSAAPDLFTHLRALMPCRIHVRFEHDTGNGRQVEIPATSLTLQGELSVEPEVDRFGVRIPGWGSQDFAWFARRRGRGRPDYWQGAIEHHPDGGPALVLYFTAPVDGLILRTSTVAGRGPGPGEPMPETGP